MGHFGNPQAEPASPPVPYNPFAANGSLLTVAGELQDWLDTAPYPPGRAKELNPMVEVGISAYTAYLQIDDRLIWTDDQDDGAKELTFAACRDEYLAQLRAETELLNALGGQE